jgi:hypothetical protein
VQLLTLINHIQCACAVRARLRCVSCSAQCCSAVSQCWSVTCKAALLMSCTVTWFYCCTTPQVPYTAASAGGVPGKSKCSLLQCLLLLMLEHRLPQWSRTAAIVCLETDWFLLAPTPLTAGASPDCARWLRKVPTVAMPCMCISQSWLRISLAHYCCLLSCCAYRSTQQSRHSCCQLERSSLLVHTVYTSSRYKCMLIGHSYIFALLLHYCCTFIHS